MFFLSNHLMGIAETLAMVAALIALLMVIHVWWKSAVERRTKLRDLCIFNGIILLISVYDWWLTADSPPTGMKCRCTISVGLRQRPC